MGLFGGREKAELDAAVAALAKPATALVVTGAMPPDHVFAPTETHFGGNPYFEAGESWPMLDGARPYDFVCQVNLRDCPERPRPDVPFDLFTVFFCWALYEEVDVERACVVRTYREPSPGKAITVPRPPAVDPDDFKVRPCAVRTERFVTYPWSIDAAPDVFAEASRVGDPRAAYEGALKRLDFLHDMRSRVGGFPTWVHDATLDGDDTIFLAQIDYEPKANNCIGDAAPIFIAVSATDSTRIQTDCFQSF
jgi:hypothetical protein